MSSRVAESASKTGEASRLCDYVTAVFTTLVTVALHSPLAHTLAPRPSTFTRSSTLARPTHPPRPIIHFHPPRSSTVGGSEVHPEGVRAGRAIEAADAAEGGLAEGAH